MEERSTVIDKSQWGAGPWHDEPDRMEWRTKAGLPGLIVRNRAGILCGYAAVPPGHPLHGLDYKHVDADVHGGLTYSDRCQGMICHTPAPGEPDDVWWFGFDCGHSMDVIPAAMTAYPELETGNGRFGERYRTIDYVRGEVESLAEQLTGVERK